LFVGVDVMMGADDLVGAITFASESDYGPIHDESVGR
jgi:hypothetical protein